MADVYELYIKYKKSAGYNIFSTILHLNVMKEILNKNFNELSKAVKDYEKYIDLLPKGESFSSRKAKGFRIKFLRLIMSYTSSIYALENNIDYFFNQSGQGLMNSAIADRLNAFKKSPERLFLFGTRNYMEHSKILEISNSISYSREEGVFVRKGMINIKKSLVMSDLLKQDSLFLKYERDRLILRPYVKDNYKDYDIDVKEAIVTGQKEIELLWEDIVSIVNKDYEPNLSETKSIHSKMINVQRKTIRKNKK